jgi:hypothetical protein
MASLVLNSAGSALGAALLPQGLDILGANISSALIGEAVGTLAGSFIDQQLFGPTVANREGPRLADLSVQTSSEGAPVPRLYGRARLSGQVIWAARFKEHVSVRETGGGGKGGGGGSSAQVTEYSYTASFAVGLCEGPVTRLGRIWADGKLLDTHALTLRFYAGGESQEPDPLIEAVEGAGNVPAYRGLSYVVFEDMPIGPYGNRVPQLAFEVFHALEGVEGEIRAVTIIPGASEFGYDPVPHRQLFFEGSTRPENAHGAGGQADWSLALDQLKGTCPNVDAASLVVAWFGTDLRAGTCELRPKVENREKVTAPEAWRVAGETRGSAQLVSRIEGEPAYGGTPSDASVIRAIQDLKARGLAAVFYPFILMDVPPDNALPDPYGGAAQAAFPWRGRITLDKAPGMAGSADGSAAAADDVAAFFGTATPNDFSVFGNVVSYSGPEEWSLRRMVLHYAHLCAAAGGVDAFLIGSELRGLTRIRSGPGTYPATAELRALARDVRGILGPSCKISYAADWSEYGAHQPGGGDLFFPLDPLWADSDVDFIGIDNYLPLSDWREGAGHLDEEAGAASIYELEYLKANIEGGEYYDWFYANEADRAAQIRTPISDGAYGKPWVFRAKDIRAFWENAHYERPGGIEAASPTPWQPRSKPIWFTEFGVPAVDKGTNQPNVFVDEKSSESALPYFSTGRRDDYIQRRGIEAFLSYWQEAGNNPVSPTYGGAMVPLGRVFLWTWDARPSPAFPQLGELWSDAENWQRGHWLNGRLGAVPLEALVRALMADVGFAAADAAGLAGTLQGYVVDRVMAPRKALEPLMLAHFFSGAETEGRILFRHFAKEPALTLGPDKLVLANEESGHGYEFTRGQETELPAAAKLTYIDSELDYRMAAVEAQRRGVKSRRVAASALPMVLRQEEAQAIADIWIQDAWVKREGVRLDLPPSLLALDPGDLVRLDLPERRAAFRLTGMSDGSFRQAMGVMSETSLYGPISAPPRRFEGESAGGLGPPDAVLLDLPLLGEGEGAARAAHAPLFAAFAEPWPGSLALYRSFDGASFSFLQDVPVAAVMGRTRSAFAAGPLWRWDEANSLTVEIGSGTLESRSDLAVLNGANLACVETQPGRFEVLQFARAELIGPGLYRLERFLRGQAGSEGEMAALLGAGARFVLLDGAVRPLALGADERRLEMNWRIGPAALPFTDPAFLSFSASFAGIGLRPLSPVQAKARRLAGGDIALTWARRTRLGGDSWEGLDVPLGEEEEMYEVEIKEGGNVKRVIRTGGPELLYPQADQLADFGAPPGMLSLSIYQLSRAYGRGAALEAELHV